jgi:hypothetical protein
MTIFAVWLPLAYPATSLAQRLVARYAVGSTPEEIARALASAPPGEIARLEVLVRVLLAIPLALAALAGGYLVGRWGRNVGVIHAALAGLVAGIVSCGLSWARGEFSWAPLAGIALAVPMSSLGGWLGRRRVAARGGVG